MSHIARQDALVASLDDLGVAGLVVTDLANVRYLTGYVGSNAVAVISPGRRVLFTDSRYIAMARAETRGVDVELAGRDLIDRVGEAARAVGGPVGIEAENLTIARRDALQGAAGDTELVPVSDAVERLRVRKSADEVAALREASRIADLAFAWAAETTLAGMREKDVAWELEGIMRSAGAQGPSFPIIVAAGPNGARPHAVPSAEPIPADTLVVVDMGAIVDGYHSDCTRTFATGPLPERLAEAYAVCLAAEQAAVAAVAPGVRCGDLDEVARGMIRDAGLGDAFGHGLGHGVGLVIHERPWLRPELTEVLEPGMAITIEPGIYLEGLGGVRIEDLVIVTEQGGDVLTNHPRTLAAG